MLPSYQENKRLYLILAAVASALIALGVWLYYRQVSEQNNGADTGTTYYDPGSHETISNPAGKTPEPGSEEPIYLGFDKLLGFGLSQYQLRATQKAFTSYAEAAKKTIREYSINVDDIKTLPYNNEDPNSRFGVSFEGVLQRTQKYKATLQYFDLTAVQLFLYDTSGKQVYDSGVVDITSAFID